MSCKCFLISMLERRMNKLTELLEMSSTVNTYKDNCMDNLLELKEQSWNVTKSDELLADTKILLSMTDELQSAHTQVVNSINKALEKMKKDYEMLLKEDEEYHKSGEVKTIYAEGEIYRLI